MRFVLKLISYIFHPLFVPIAGTMTYFLITPKYNTEAIENGNILPIFILSIIIPLIAYFILTNIGFVASAFSPTINERKYALYIEISLLLMIMVKVIPNNYISELYYFFLGLLGASFACLLLLFFKYKSSIHMIGMGSILMYAISLSIHFEINITLAIGAITLITGLVASSRLFQKSHSKYEIFLGFLIGLVSQLMTLKFWL